MWHVFRVLAHSSFSVVQIPEENFRSLRVAYRRNLNTSRTRASRVKRRLAQLRCERNSISWKWKCKIAHMGLSVSRCHEGGRRRRYYAYGKIFIRRVIRFRDYGHLFDLKQRNEGAEAWKMQQTRNTVGWCGFEIFYTPSTSPLLTWLIGCKEYN